MFGYIILFALCAAVHSSGAGCPEGWRMYGSSCYYFSTDALSWNEALEQCKALQSYLVEIESMEENTFLASVASSSLDKAYYIGLSDSETEGVWKWVTSGNRATFLFWAPGEPNDMGLWHGEDCAHLVYSHPDWDDCSCSGPYNYICEKQWEGCNASKDHLDLQWDRGAKGNFTRRSCPDGYKGEAKRYCDEDGVYEEPVYNCTIMAVADILDQVLNSSVEVKPATLLKFLTEVTSTGNENNGLISSEDMNNVIKLMSVVTDTVAQNMSDADKNVLADSFMETTSNIIGNSTAATWKNLINETGVGADAVLDNVDRFLEKALNENDTMEIEKPNLYIKKEPTDDCEKGIMFPNRSKDKIPEWLENSNNSIVLRCNDKRNISSFSGVIYRNVSQIMPSTFGPERDFQQQQLNSPVVSFSYYPKVESKLKNPVEITFQTDSNASDNQTCAFWKKTKGQLYEDIWRRNVCHRENVVYFRAQGYWSREGCWLHQYDRQDNIVVCKCDHLTNFAVLMSLSPSTAIGHQLALNIITKTGLITSLVFLLITIVVYCVFWRYVKSVQSIIKLNLSCMLFLANLLFLTGIDRTGNKILCTAIAGLLHLMYVSVFAIMLALGLDLAYLVVKPMHTHTPGLRLLCAFYGLSVLIVAVSMGVVQLEGYGNEKVCWLSAETWLIWTFLVPVMLTILMNLIIVAVVIKIMCGTTHMSKKTRIGRVKSGVRGIIVLMPIMGLTWLFGIISIEEKTVVFQYLFAVFNSLQGFFIFMFHCVMNEKVAGGKMRARWLSSESRNTTSELKS